MQIRNIISFILAIAVLAACRNTGTQGEFTVAGSYRNAEHPASIGQSKDTNPVSPVRKVYLYEIPFGKDNAPVVIDSGVINGNDGKFQLQGEGKEEGVYELTFDNGLIVLLGNDSKNIEVDIDLSKKDNYYTVKGSPATQEMKDFITAYNDYRVKVNNAFGRMDSLKSLGAADSLILASTVEKNSQIETLNRYIKNFISKTSHPGVALVALGWASRSFTKQEFEAVLNDIVKKFPAHEGVAILKKDYDSKQAQMAEMQRKQKEYEAKQNIWTGKIAPDLALPDANGKMVSISSFRGKYVLVDFWASWCRPCRIENPNLVKAFNQFKDKNFTVLGVSLDNKKEDWLRAIQDDQLTWAHISDLQYWESKAVKVFQFDGIPYNILIDPSGKVIAEALRGEELERKLRELLP